VETEFWPEVGFRPESSALVFTQLNPRRPKAASMDLRGDPIGKYEAIGTDLGHTCQRVLGAKRSEAQMLRSANARRRRFGAEN